MTPTPDLPKPGLPYTPPPEMPDFDTCRDIGGIGVCKCWRVHDDDGPTAIERYAQQQRERADTLAAENRRMREALDLLRPKVLLRDPDYTGQRTNGPPPRWNGMLKVIDDALTPPTPQEGDTDDN